MDDERIIVMFKKKIMNVSKLDFTNYSPQALKKIGRIINCATIYLPENPSNEFMEAFSEIKLTNVANTIYLPNDKTVCNVNGMEVLTNVNPKNFYIVNGFAFVASAISDESVQMVVNGEVFYKDNINIDFVSLNGQATPMNFDYEKAKIYQNKIEINADFIRNSEAGTVIICMNKIKISEDVTEEMLKEKDFHFICQNKIYCKNNVQGYVAANSKLGNRIVTDEKEYLNWENPLIKKKIR